MNLPESGPVVLMHQVAPEIFVELGGEAVLRHIGFYEAILGRWNSDAERKPGDREALRCMGAIERGYVKLAALREQAWLQARAEVFQQTGERIPLPQTPETYEREQSAEEAALVKQLSRKLREVGAMVKDMDQGQGQEMAAKGSGASTGSGQVSFSGGSLPEKVPDPVVAGAGKGSGTISRIQPREMEPDPSAQKTSQTLAHPAERPSGKQIKAGIRRLIDAQVDRKAVESLREQAKSGTLTREQFFERVEELQCATV
jgi:hypothetical protein